MSQDNTRWRVEASAVSSLKGSDDAIVVLRLGAAISALRASQRLTLCVGKGDEPKDERDRLWAFLISIGYLHEMRVMLQPLFPHVRDLALSGGASTEDVRAVGEVISGRLEFSKVLDRVRNELVFHFDEDTMKNFIDEFDRDIVRWADGVGPKTGNVIYRASNDAISSAILPGVDGSSQEGREKLVAVIEEVLRITNLVTKYFEHAIAGYLNGAGARMIESA